MNSYYCSLLLKCTYIVLVAILFSSCANISAPTGGPRDEKPPVLKKVFPPDSTLLWKGNQIIFEFNEFIQLKDVAEQVVVTPLIKPELFTNKKKLVVRIADSLLEKNTTYHIDFGNAIRDINESNAITSLQYTFSTGRYFDSAQIKGQVINARTGIPDTNVWILLYPAHFSDTAILNSSPRYALKSPNGAFVFSNLPSRAFRIFALSDVNKNMKYDHPEERIGYLDSVVTSGMTTRSLVLYTFREENTGIALSKSQKAVAQPPKELNFSLNVDTAQKNKRTFDLVDTLRIQFNKPITQFDPTSIRLFQGEIYDANTTVTYDSVRTIICITTDWMEDAPYTLNLIAGFAVDSSKKAQAGMYTFRTMRKSDYGSIRLTNVKRANYIVELLKEGIVMRTVGMKNQDIVFDLLKPATYQIRLVEDANGNGLWDTGSFKKFRKQPERVVLYGEDILIKANWEQKIDMQSIEQEKKEGMKSMKK